LLPLLNIIGGENKMKMIRGHSDDREIASQLPSEAKQTHLGES